MTVSATNRGLKPGVCTSTARPANPFDGMMIYETDTNLVRIWNGSAWRTLAYSDYTSGSVLQVASTFKADAFSTTSTSFVDVTGLSVDITPVSTSSKVFVLAYVTTAGSTTNDYYLNLNRGSTAIAQTTSGSTISTWHGLTTSTGMNMAATITFLDSPATTSSTTYKIQARAGSDTMYVNRRGGDTIGSTSSITVMEIAG